MATRILGPTRSRRRRRFLLAPIFLVAVVALFLTTGAQAVHDTGLFELDKTATVDANATNDPAVPGDDWDQVFAGTDNAIVSTFITDPSDAATDSHFTGGSTKDHNDLSEWQHTQKKPSPPKDDLTDAYAAAYADPDDDHLIVYFGMDRFANNGDAQIGFWFFQNEISLNDDGTFSGVHTQGDILVLSDFTQGGDISTIRVLEWVDNPTCDPGSNPDCLDPNLLQIEEGVDCDVTAGGDDVCASVNRGVVDAPWPYSAKFPPPAPNENDFPSGSFYEGGIDVTELIPDVSCFTSFLAESRSSQSVDAVLKDFALGSFPTCEAEITTTPSDASIQLGESISDTAVVDGEGLNPPTPTGFVKFFICSPSELTNGTCATGGTFVDVGGDEPDGEALTPDPTDPTKANAESDLFTPDVVGTWCWRGEYSGDDFYDPVTDSSDGECFTVTDTSSTSTAQNWRPNDSATVTSTGGSALAGSVAFTLYDNGTCDGTVLYTETRPVSGASPQMVNTTNDGSSVDDVLVSATATVSWRAVFTSTNSVEGSTAPCESTVLTIDNDITTP